MLEARYHGAGTIAVGTSEAADPGPGEVSVDVAYTGICGTDLHIYHGHMDARVHVPAVIGHEMSGRVAALGAGVHGWAVGEPVTVMPLDWCGACPACEAGNSHVCQRLTFIGIDAPGAMQQSWVVPERTLVRLPDGLPLRSAALVEPVAVAVHDVRRAEVAAGEQVLVVGGGPVGVLIALVARHSGAEVLLAEVDPARRGFARDLGLRAVDPVADDLAALLDEWTKGAGVRIAFEVSGAAAGVTAAVDSLAVRGRLCLVAIHPTPREVNLHRFFWRELTLVGARLYTRDDFMTAAELVGNATIPAELLITHVEPLASAERAFEILAEGTGQMKVLVDCTAPGDES
jgi:(R,R)-butanediol dehydrogenase / meso-butanediol dehydrogenase / diacetyl reductase